MSKYKVQCPKCNHYNDWGPGIEYLECTECGLYFSAGDD